MTGMVGIQHCWFVGWLVLALSGCEQQEEGPCRITERVPTEEDMLGDQRLGDLAEGLSGRYVGSFSWLGGVEHAFTVEPESGLTEVIVDLDLPVESIVVVEGERVGFPGVRTGCPKDFKVNATANIRSTDGALNEVLESVSRLDPTGTAVAQDLWEEGPSGSLEVVFSHADFWDEINVNLSVVAAQDELVGAIDVVWVEDRDVNGKTIAHWEAVPE